MNRISNSVLNLQIEKEAVRIKSYSEQLKVCGEGQAETLKSLIRGAQYRQKRAERLLACRSAAEQLKAAERLSEPV